MATRTEHEAVTSKGSVAAPPRSKRITGTVAYGNADAVHPMPQAGEQASPSPAPPAPPVPATPVQTARSAVRIPLAPDPVAIAQAEQALNAHFAASAAASPAPAEAVSPEPQDPPASQDNAVEALQIPPASSGSRTQREVDSLSPTLAAPSDPPKVPASPIEAQRARLHAIAVDPNTPPSRRSGAASSPVGSSATPDDKTGAGAQPATPDAAAKAAKSRRSLRSYFAGFMCKIMCKIRELRLGRSAPFVLWRNKDKISAPSPTPPATGKRTERLVVGIFLLIITVCFLLYQSTSKPPKPAPTVAEKGEWKPLTHDVLNAKFQKDLELKCILRCVDAYDVSTNAWDISKGTWVYRSTAHEP